MSSNYRIWEVLNVRSQMDMNCHGYCETQTHMYGLRLMVTSYASVSWLLVNKEKVHSNVMWWWGIIYLNFMLSCCRYHITMKTGREKEEPKKRNDGRTVGGREPGMSTIRGFMI